jgi:hypothetical protein
MRLLRLVPLGALLMLCVSATCVTDVRQKGPEGPWVGEVVNNGDQTVNFVQVMPAIFDSTGHQLYGQGGSTTAIACPSTLLPGEHGAFEAFFIRAQDGQPTSVPPLRAEFPPVAIDFPGEGALRGDGLLAEVAQESTREKSIIVRVTNNSMNRYSDVTVCGILRANDGEVLSVGRADGPAFGDDLTILAPGQSITLTMLFDEVPDGGTTLYPRAILRGPTPPCCMPGPSASHRVNTGPFSVMLPPGWAYDPAQGIDSFVGSFVGDGVTLGFDYGVYSNNLPYDDDPAYRVHHESIGGYRSKIVMALAPGGVTGVYFEDLGPTTIPVFEGQYRTRLQVSGTGLTPEQQAIALQIFRSLRFQDP